MENISNVKGEKLYYFMQNINWWWQIDDSHMSQTGQQ